MNIMRRFSFNLYLLYDIKYFCTEYLKNNDRFHIDYKIIATNNIDTTKLKIELVPNSGRKLDEQISADSHEYTSKI